MQQVTHGPNLEAETEVKAQFSGEELFGKVCVGWDSRREADVECRGVHRGKGGNAGGMGRLFDGAIPILAAVRKPTYAVVAGLLCVKYNEIAGAKGVLNPEPNAQ